MKKPAKNRTPPRNTIRIRNLVLLLDFDGTVVETEILAKKVIDVYFQEKNILNQFHFGDMIIGRTWKLATENMVADADAKGLKLGDPRALEKELKRRYREELKRGAPLIPGFREKLPVLKQLAKKVGIVTGSDRDEVNLILSSHGLQDEFDRIWAFGDYEHSKPHPSPFLAALKGFGIGPAEALAFEDSTAGMESAHQAGLKWVQIAYEGHAKPDGRSLLVARDWNEIEFE